MKKYDEIVIILLFEQLLNMYEYTIIQASRNIDSHAIQSSYTYWTLLCSFINEIWKLYHIEW